VLAQAPVTTTLVLGSLSSATQPQAVLYCDCTVSLNKAGHHPSTCWLCSMLSRLKTQTRRRGCGTPPSPPVCVATSLTVCSCLCGLLLRWHARYGAHRHHRLSGRLWRCALRASAAVRGAAAAVPSVPSVPANHHRPRMVRRLVGRPVALFTLGDAQLWDSGGMSCPDRGRRCSRLRYATVGLLQQLGRQLGVSLG